MKGMINSNPLNFEGLRKNEKRPPLTMEPSTDDPLAATTVTPAKAGVQRENMDSRLRGNDGRVRENNKSHHPCVAGNESTEAGGETV